MNLVKVLFVGAILIASMSTYANVKVGGIHHLGLSVSKLKESEDFFVNQIGFRVFKRDVKYPSVFLTNDEVIITLWQVKNPEKAI